ncbi:response regulator [Gramella sp. AN32]|uniref:LytR/AlgR family response regulator transcription factor n=1 Tax=Christiangramia antarctica TaxID=2058158 RepID=A0ABW5X0T3_9FLAO|nr:response regulator [Gramella sp. AN32]MCM4156972.1 DNA-binding response regulator [Gramella sp. AN32]
MKLNCVIIDDEPLAIKVLLNYASQVEQLEVTGTFTNALQSLKFLQENEVDLLFLDINMPLIDGFSLLESLSKKPKVIITSAHSEYALKGFEMDVLDYMVKPISFPRFLKAVNKIRNNFNDIKISKDYIFVKVDTKKMKKIYLDEIFIVESLKDYVKIITPSKNFVVHQTLAGFTENLPKSQFIRIHRSHTISIDKVTALEGNRVEINGTKYTIGRNYLEKTRATILN